MTRTTLGKVLSSLAGVLALIFAVAAGLLFWGSTYVHGQVHDQLVAQKIYFPERGSAALTALPSADQKAMVKYAGKQLTTGAQAEVWADHYIKIHLKKVAGGKTYSQVSAEALQQPTNQELQKQADTLFRGETLRGLLLNAYAFDTMAVLAWWAGWGAIAGLIVFAGLSVFGFRRAGRLEVASTT